MRKYGWPVVLFVGIPFVAWLGRSSTLLVYDLATSGNAGSYELSLWLSAARSCTAAVVLGVLYPRLRNAGPPILRLAWSYTLVLQALSALLFFGAAFASCGDSLPLLFRVYWLHALLAFLPLVWFAHRASRASLTHAYFLVFIIGGLALPDLPETLPSSLAWLWERAGDILAVWLLASFDGRGLRFRRSAAAVVVELAGLVYLPPLLFPFVLLLESVVLQLLFLLQLLVIYLVRVRQPALPRPAG